MLLTSVLYCLKAVVIPSYMSKYLRKKRGLNSCVIPNISCVTSTCPSTPPPAPIPITGIEMLSATFCASVAGTFSKTIAKHPILSSNKASSNNLSASSSSFALTVYVPNLHVGDNTIIDGQAYTPEHITSSAHTASTISLDFDDGSVQTITLSADTDMVLANPTNINNGAGYMVIVKQGISGGTLNFGTNYLWEGGAQPIITPTLNAVDVLSFVCFEYTGGTSALLGAYTQNFS